MFQQVYLSPGWLLPHVDIQVWSCMCVQLLSHIWLFATPWTVACQAPLSMGFSRQEYWSGLPSTSPGDLPNSVIKPASPALAGGFFTTEPPGKLHPTVKPDPFSLGRIYTQASLMAQMVKNLPAKQETRIRSLLLEDPLEESMANIPVFLPGESHGQRSLAGYSPWGCKESDMTEQPNNTNKNSSSGRKWKEGNPA